MAEEVEGVVVGAADELEAFVDSGLIGYSRSRINRWLCSCSFLYFIGKSEV